MTMKPKNYISKDANISKQAVVEAPVRIYGSTKLGRLVNVGRFSYIHTRSTVHSGSSVARYCSIGKNVEIGPFDHPMERLSTSPVSYNMHLHFPDYVDVVKREKLPRDEEPAKIGNDVWIGSNSIVIRGVTIGNGAVVGAGSVVTKDVAPYSIVAGIPARHVRFRFAKDICETLNALEWWNLPVEQLEHIPFADVEKSIEAIKLLRSAPPTATQEPESPIDETPNVVASSGEGSDSETPSKQQPEEAAEQKDATVLELRAQIANIEQGKPDTPHAKANAKKKADFLAYIQHKLFELDTPSTVLELLEQNVKKLHIEYDLLNGENLEILNNKVLAINDLAICDTAESGELSTDVKKMILSIMSSKT